MEAKLRPRGSFVHLNPTKTGKKERIESKMDKYELGGVGGGKEKRVVVEDKGITPNFL